jgi:ribose transport system substrate-binding protein
MTSRRTILGRSVSIAMGGLASLLFACDEHPVDKPPSPAAAAGDPPAAKPRVALVMKTLTNPFFAEMERGARRAETDLGIELLVRTAAQETSIEQQIALVEDLIRAHVGGIVIAPGDSVKLIPVLRKARDAGIAVVNIDSRLDPEVSRQQGLDSVPFISVDNEHGAYLAAKVLAAGVTVPTEAAVIEGIRGAANAAARLQGALAGFAENPNIRVVARESANWKIDEAHEVAASVMTAHPNVRLIFCANDMMALGVLRYLREQSLQGMRVAGFDALAEVRPALRDGQLAVTIDQQAAEQGMRGVQAAVALMKGQTQPPVTLLEVGVITAPSRSP